MVVVMVSPSISHFPSLDHTTGRRCRRRRRRRRCSRPGRRAGNRPLFSTLSTTCTALSARQGRPHRRQTRHDIRDLQDREQRELAEQRVHGVCNKRREPGRIERQEQRRVDVRIGLRAAGGEDVCWSGGHDDGGPAGGGRDRGRGGCRGRWLRRSWEGLRGGGAPRPRRGGRGRCRRGHCGCARGPGGIGRCPGLLCCVAIL